MAEMLALFIEIATSGGFSLAYLHMKKVAAPVPKQKGSRGLSDCVLLCIWL
jgi:hypothetical protein